MLAARVLLAQPRGFCAGVESAVKSLAWMVVLHRPPVFCVHAVVHNEDVVARFERLGVRFVDDPDDVPPGAPVLLSAHGSAPEVVERARGRASVVVDAVCPLVTKVHHEIRTRARSGGTVLYVGHAGHDEAVGAMAQAPGSVVRVESAADVATATLPGDGAAGPDRDAPAVLAQTTLAYDAWLEVVDAARRRFGDVWLPPRDDLCFATTNRQSAARALAERCDAVVVVGSPSSSNTRALADTARRAGSPVVVRVAGPEDLPSGRFGAVGVTAGASTPDDAVRQVVGALRPRQVETVEVTEESEYFPLARPVRQRLRDLAGRGTLEGVLHDAVVGDRTTSADELLRIIESDDLVGELAAMPPGGAPAPAMPPGGAPAPVAPPGGAPAPVAPAARRPGRSVAAAARRPGRHGAAPVPPVPAGTGRPGRRAS